MADEVIFLSFWPSMFGMRTMIPLEEKGVKYEYREEDVISNKSALLLRMNLIHEKIPVLIHSGKTVCESIIQIQYIDEIWSNKNPFLLTDPYQRAQALFWADFIEKKLFLCGRKTWATKGEELETTRKELIEILKTLQSELGDKPYFDIRVCRHCPDWILQLVSRYQKFGNFNIEPQCSKLMAWGKRCMQRESVALPDSEKVVGYVLQLKKISLIPVFCYV